MATTPYEIVAQPFTLWLAPLATAFPLIDVAPSGTWIKLGTSGELNYTEKGVTVAHEQKVKTWSALGSVGPRKAFRTEESLKITLSLVDVTLEQYLNALNYNVVTSTPAVSGFAGFKKLGLSRGFDVPQRALLIRGVGASPYGTGWNMQYEVPIAVQMATPTVTFMKGEPAGLEMEFLALEDASAGSPLERFGRLVGQYQTAL